MKVSYKVLQKYIPDIPEVSEVARMLVMHTAEVEGIHSQAKDFEHIVYGKITSVESHANSDSLKVCMVDIGENEEVQIVCGGSNLEIGQGVAVAKIGASVLWHGQGDPVVMKKTAIRGVESYGMICASEEIGLKDEFPAKSETEILDISHLKAKTGTPLDVVLEKDDAILEVDNKAINHRPDMFSHIGVAREIQAIRGQKLDFEYEQIDFGGYKDAGVKNLIPEVVKRYMAIKVSAVANTQSPAYIKEVLQSADVGSKGILVDITNYSLYLYGQPTHCFDADTLTGNIQIRYAKNGETFIALNDKSYELTENDIVIADDAGVIALGGVIGGKNSAVSEKTKNIIIEAAWFDQAIVRKTGKIHGLRTDALNIFEKDIVCAMQEKGASLIVSELQKIFPKMEIEAISDIYPKAETNADVPYDLDFIRRLIGRNYEEKEVLEILKNLGIEKLGDALKIPFWRKDITRKADIAEEIARIDGYHKVEATVPRINLGAIIQTPIYKLMQDSREFLVDRGFYDMYNYSFVSNELMQKLGSSVETCIPLKNALSEEITHMRNDLIPNLLLSLEGNIREKKNLKLFEIGKIFHFSGNEIQENYELAAVVTQKSENLYYPIQALITDILKNLGVDNFYYELGGQEISYSHSGRVSKIIVRGKEIGYIGEIHPKIASNFDVTERIAFFKLNLDLLTISSYAITKAKEVSSFQENNFDLNFVVEKTMKGKEIQAIIEKTSPLIQSVELFDIYENEEKLPGKRSLSFKIFIQSLEETLSDTIKNQLIKDIIQRVEKKGGKLR